MDKSNMKQFFWNFIIAFSVVGIIFCLIVTIATCNNNYLEYNSKQCKCFRERFLQRTSGSHDIYKVICKDKQIKEVDYNFFTDDTNKCRNNE